MLLVEGVPFLISLLISLLLCYPMLPLFWFDDPKVRGKACAFDGKQQTMDCSKAGCSEAIPGSFNWSMGTNMGCIYHGNS